MKKTRFLPFNGMVVILILQLISCKNPDQTEPDFSPVIIKISPILLDIHEIELFIITKEEKVNLLISQSEQLINEYKAITKDRQVNKSLIGEVKKVAILNRINSTIEKLSEIYTEFEQQSTEIENRLNSEQKEAYRPITDQFKNRINEVTIYSKSIVKQHKPEKILIY
jgi:hypothetical protein